MRYDKRAGRGRGPAAGLTLEARALAAIRRNGGSLWGVPASNQGLFTDSVGTTPATAVGDVLGLVTDRAYGNANLGPELRGAGVVSTTGNAAVAAYNTATGSGAAYRVDVFNQSGVVFQARPGSLCQISITVLTGQVRLRNGSIGETIIGLDLGPGTYILHGIASIPLSGGALAYIAVSAATPSVTFTINSVREVFGRHAAQPTTASKPVISALPNGRRAMRFDGLNDFTSSLGPLQYASDHWVCCGVIPHAIGASPVIYASGSTTSNTGRVAEIRMDPTLRCVWTADSGVSYGFSATSFTPTVNVPFVASVRKVGQLATLRVNGNQIGSEVLPTGVVITPSVEGIGASLRGSGVVNYANISIVLVSGKSTLSDPDRQTIERYLAQQIGAQYLG